jgi:lauroyl/myristoyl acyltransferase
MEREALVDSLSARQREKLSELDDSYYNLTEVLMAQCEAFVAAHPEEFPT